MPGAVRLAGEAALRSGAGRVSMATHPSHAGEVIPWRRAPSSCVTRSPAPAELDRLLAKADVIAFGPGLGQTEWSRTMFACVAQPSLPAVWDADGLNLLAQQPGRAANRIITPHPGEAAALLGTTTADVQSDRAATLALLADRYGGTAVLKGAGSLVSTDSVPFLCTAGNPGMAAAGMGDVLTGIIAGLLAQGLSLQDAATIGVEVHARAGDRAALAGERGMLASDLMAELRGVLNP